MIQFFCFLLCANMKHSQQIKFEKEGIYVSQGCTETLKQILIFTGCT